MFLKYPSLFLDANRTSLQFSRFVTNESNTVIKGENNEPDRGDIEGIVLCSGLPRRVSSEAYYSSGRPMTILHLGNEKDTLDYCTPEVNISEGIYTVKYQRQLLIYENNSYNLSGRNYQHFSRIVMADIKNTAYIDHIPEVKSILQRFVAESPFNPDQGGWNPNMRPTLYPIEVTSEQLENLDMELHKQIVNHVYNEPDSFVVGKNRTYDLQLGARTGIDHRIVGDIMPQSTVSWWAPSKIASHYGSSRRTKLIYEKEAVGGFDISLNIDNTNSDLHKFYLYVSWERPPYDSRPTNNGNGGQGGHLLYPKIHGLVFNYSIPGLRTAPSRESTEPILAVNYKRKVTDRTKKRPSQGTYKGKYEGIESIIHNGISYFSLANEYALSAHMSDCLPNIKSHTDLGWLIELPRLPMSLANFNNIEKPHVEVKPLQVGHLELRRLGAPDKKLVGAELLSDLLMPSMPDIILNIDTAIKVTSNDTYVDGTGCYGHCSDETVNLPIPPGLYLVRRVEKCSLGHDKGRQDYTAGFGDECNEIITIRKMLTQLSVAYDEVRANYVGNKTSTMPTKTGPSSALWRLG